MLIQEYRNKQQKQRQNSPLHACSSPLNQPSHSPLHSAAAGSLNPSQSPMSMGKYMLIKYFYLEIIIITLYLQINFCQLVMIMSFNIIYIFC